MVKKIMDLYLLLYCMAGLGVLGAAGMLATNLSYRRIIRKTGRLSIDLYGIVPCYQQQSWDWLFI